MPLRPEFRVFYDFDRHQPLYVVNYWDWNYCHDAICRDYTDKIVYEAHYPQLLDQYNKYKDDVVKMVAADFGYAICIKAEGVVIHADEIHSHIHFVRARGAEIELEFVREAAILHESLSKNFN